MAKKVQGEKPATKAIPKCSVCMETNAYVAINCAHKFCMKCITKWVKVNIKQRKRNQSCPLCRAQISQIKYGTRVKKVERRRKRQSNLSQGSPRLRFRITWKPVFFIGIPCMPRYMASLFVIHPPLH